MVWHRYAVPDMTLEEKIYDFHTKYYFFHTKHSFVATKLLEHAHEILIHSWEQHPIDRAHISRDGPVFDA